MSVYILFFDGSPPLGYLFTGWLAGLYGAPAALLIGALLGLAVAVIGVAWYLRLPLRSAAGEPWHPTH